MTLQALTIGAAKPWSRSLSVTGPSRSTWGRPTGETSLNGMARTGGSGKDSATGDDLHDIETQPERYIRWLSDLLPYLHRAMTKNQIVKTKRMLLMMTVKTERKLLCGCRGHDARCFSDTARPERLRRLRPRASGVP